MGGAQSKPKGPDLVGDRFDGKKVEAYPPGSAIILAGDTSHFHWAKSAEYATQVTAIGPLGLEYLDPDDDPRGASFDDGVSPTHEVGPAAR